MAGAQGKLSKKVVVCVEDDFSFGELISLMLEHDGFRVVHAGTGGDAIRMVEDLHPDLVILDLMLPDLHGWEIIERMREHTALRDTPVIVVTALSSDADQTLAQDVAGVSAYLTKPIDPAHFRRVVAEALAGD